MVDSLIDKGKWNNKAPTYNSVGEVREQEEMLLTFIDEDETLARIKNHYKSDLFFKMILDSPKTYYNFEQRNGYIVLKARDHIMICVPDVIMDECKARECLIAQVHSVLAHLGTVKMLAYLQDHFWWKLIMSDIQKYCESCQTYKWSKLLNQKPYGL